MGKEALALLVNDLHCSKDSIDGFRKNWNEVLDICTKHDIYDILVGGDVFTAQASQTLPVILAVRHALSDADRRGMTVTIANGNHDKADKEAIEGYCHVFRGLRNVEVVDECKVMGWDGCDKAIVMWSYFPENGGFAARFDEGMRRLIESTSYINGKEDVVLYLHEGIKGAMGMELDTELPREMFEGYHAVLVGHYHNRLHIPDTRIYYIGASRQHNFGEDEEKGYTIFYDDGSWEFVKNRVNTRYKTLEVDYDAVDPDELEGYCGTDDMQGYKVRIRVNCTERQAKKLDRQALLDMGFSKVELKTEVTRQDMDAVCAIDEKYDKVGIVREYCNFCKEKEIDANMGMEYLNTIDQQHVGTEKDTH